MAQKRKVKRPTDFKRPPRFQTKFTTSRSFRTIHADGAWGGVTPQGLINMASFSETRPFPQSVTYTLENEALKEESRIEDQSIIREVEVGVMMSLPVARALRKWLDERIQQLEQTLSGPSVPAPLDVSSQTESK